MPWGPFHEQRIYNRRQDIHAVYGGQQQGGICTPSKHAVIIVFTGSSGEQHGYADGWCQRAPKSPQLWAFKIPWPAGSVRIGDQPAV